MYVCDAAVCLLTKVIKYILTPNTLLTPFLPGIENIGKYIAH